MDDRAPARTLAGQPEPAGMTLADLSALVIGSGLACARIGQPGWFPPGSQIHLDFAIFCAGWLGANLALAATPVLLARCWRYGRQPRPVEWLVILIAAIIVAGLFPDAAYLVQVVGNNRQLALAPAWV